MRRHLLFCLAAGVAVLSVCFPGVLAQAGPRSRSGACGFIPLFDGRTLNGWTTADGRPVTKGWTVTDGAIHRTSNGGNIFTEAQFGSFILEFQWKVAPGGNSGVKYKVQHFPGKGLLGCEYQIVDDAAHADGKRPKTSAGSLYALYEPAPWKRLNLPGQWNSARIVVCGSYIEHWLNGQRILCADTQSEDWRHRVAHSKFADVPGFGQNELGRIMLQDHGDEVWYRDLRIMPLVPATHRPSWVIRRPWLGRLLLRQRR